MDFQLDEARRALRRAIVEFARAELNAGIEERDREERFDAEGWRKCGAFGLLGAAVPAEYGGMGADPETLVTAMEAFGFGCRDNGLVFAVGNHLFSCVVPIVKFGTVEQKARYLPGLARGTLVGAHAMTEPTAGSETAAVRTTAERRDDHYLVHGGKTFITNAPIADVFVVFARTSAAATAASLTAFVLERTTPGLRVGRAVSKMGLRTTPMAELTFDACRVPVSQRLGGEGGGAMVFSAAVESERCYLSAANLGAMKRQLDDCVAYARRRRQFGQPIGGFQAVSHALAAVKVDLELAELMLYKVAWLRARRKPAFFEAAAVKLFTSESYVRAARTALQVHGAFGYMTASGVERQLRDALASTIYAGTSEIQKDIIGSWMGLGPDAAAAPTRGKEHAHPQTI